MPFAQLVVGPPGSGKSTYCDGMHQFMNAIHRKCSVVNLDPANDHTSYPAALDIRDLVTLDEIMASDELGPNGGVLFALEELEHNFEWLQDGLKQLGGQVELFTHHSSLRNIFFRLEKLGYRLVVLHLVDSHSLTLPSLYISSLLLSLRSMLQLDLPHLNVLTKIDKLSSYPPRPFNLDFYTEVQELSYLLPHLQAENPGRLGSEKFEGLNKAICELVQDFQLVSFETLAVENKRSMMGLLRAIDRASGYAFGPAEGANETVWQIAMGEGAGAEMDIMDVQERWIDRKDELDELEEKEWEEEGRWRKGQSGIEGQVEAGEELPSNRNEQVDNGNEDEDEELASMIAEAKKAKDSGIKVVRKS
ncbi:MAG: hypothetical protein M1822_003393 [Bathelium mastoideum]|nr:MAG: hypothetical protein M1822_003393 [Bathelium mastoideum]